MENKNLNLMIVAFVALIVGIVLIGTVASNVISKTSKTVVENEAISLTNILISNGLVYQVNESASNFTMANAPTGWQLNDDVSCPLTNLVYSNSTTTYVLNTDYEVYLRPGIVHVLNTTTTQNGGNSTLVDYKYCGDDYLNSAFGRSISNLVPGFFALALLGIALLLFYSVAKNEGWLKQ